MESVDRLKVMQIDCTACVRGQSWLLFSGNRLANLRMEPTRQSSPAIMSPEARGSFATLGS
jgi:hypothetical protein